MQSFPTAKPESPSPNESPLPDARNNQRHNGRRRLRWAFVFGRFDLWGIYYDRNERHLYLLPLPFIGVKFWFEPLTPGSWRITTTESRFPEGNWYSDPAYTIGRLHEAVLHDVQWRPPAEGRKAREMEYAHWENPEHALKRMLEIFRNIDTRASTHMMRENDVMRRLLGRRP